MKKLVLMLSLVAGAFTVSNSKLKFLPPATLPKLYSATCYWRCGQTSKGIVDELTKTLGLEGGQSKSTLDEVTKFLGSKSDFLGLAKTNPTDYLNKSTHFKKAVRQIEHYYGCRQIRQIFWD